MAVRIFNSIRVICTLGLMLAVLDYEAAATTKKPGFFRFFKGKPKTPTSTEKRFVVHDVPINSLYSVQDMKALMGRNTVGEPASLVQPYPPMQDIEAMRNLAALVLQEPANESTTERPLRTAIVGAIAKMLTSGEGVANLKVEFRDKILRPCKQVHTWPEEPWWNEKLGPQINKEWLTMKEVCTFIVLNVDSYDQSLIEDVITSCMLGRNVITKQQLESARHDTPLWRSTDDVVPEKSSNIRWAAISTIQSLLEPRDINTLRSLGALVRKKTIDHENEEVAKAVVVSALSSMISEYREVGSCEAQFRDRILRPCKQVHSIFTGQWWESKHPKSELTERDIEWLTIKRVCTVIIRNVDSYDRSLIEDVITSCMLGGNANTKQQSESARHDTPLWRSTDDVVPEKSSNIRWAAISTIQSLLEPRDINTLRSLGALVRKKTIDHENEEVAKAVVVSALSSMLSEYREVSSYEAQFRDGILRPCKQVHSIFTGQWWESKHPKSELTERDIEWLTIKRVCTFIVLNVDSSHSSLITESYVAPHTSLGGQS